MTILVNVESGASSRTVGPMLVAHADWGVDPRKQWVAVARSDARGRWSASGPERLRRVGPLRQRMHVDDGSGTVVLGFDFPIGVPRAYAERVGIDHFPSFLAGCGVDEWRDFIDVSDSADDISLRRPFYPRTYLPKGSRQHIHLTDALHLSYDQLLRRCERAQQGRRAACSLFWTCGGNQVGKGALAGWHLLRAEPPTSLRWWPFDGTLTDLVDAGGTIVTETYPAEYTRHLGLGRVVGKRRQEVRREHAPALLQFARASDIDLEAELEDAIDDGFGSAGSGEDQFDAIIGLFGMLNVLTHRQSANVPDDDAVRSVEGWILWATGGSATYLRLKGTDRGACIDCADFSSRKVWVIQPTPRHWA